MAADDVNIGFQAIHGSCGVWNDSYAATYPLWPWM